MSDTPWFDREEILGTLEKRVTGLLAGYRQNCALLGCEGIGKTTLLKRFLEERLDGAQPLVAFSLEVRQKESVPEWANRFLQSLLYGVLKAKLVPTLPADLSGLLESCSSWIPQTVQAVQRLLKKMESSVGEEIYDGALELPQRVTQESGFSCLIILDEFHRLRDLGIADPFRRLGRAIMVQNATMYLVASSQVGPARHILREGLNLLFGQFEVIEMGPLSPEMCRRALEARGLDPFLEYLLMELAQGSPTYLDLLLTGFNRGVSSSSTEDQERSILDLLEELFLDPQGSLRLRFEERLRMIPTHRSRHQWIQVLRAVAEGAHRVRQIAEVLDRAPVQVAKSLRLLKEKDCLNQQGVFYRIDDRLFQLWLLIAYPILEGVGLHDSAQGRAHFRDAAWLWMMKGRQTLHRPIEEKAAELLALWRSEQVEVEGHRILLPRFESVKTFGGPGGWPLIVAHRPGAAEAKTWLVIPWSGFLEEPHARQIAQEVGYLPFKFHRKFLLGAYPVEMHARLVLQEAKIRLWDADVLNNLLDLYGLTRIPFPLAGDTRPDVLPAAAPDAHASQDTRFTLSEGGAG